MPERSTAEANKALVRRWFEEVWNKGRAEAIEEMFGADGIVHGLSDDARQDRRALEQLRLYENESPDWVAGQFGLAKLAQLQNRARTGVPGGAAPLGWWMRRMLASTQVKNDRQCAAQKSSSNLR